MDLVILAVQIILVVLLVVTPLFSGFDKFWKWSPSRKLLAVALGAAIAVVAFSQYQRLVMLNKSSLPEVVSGFGQGRAPWYARRLMVAPWEYLLSVLAGSAILALSIDAGRHRQWKQAAIFGGFFVVMLAVAVAVKLRLWH